MTFPKSRIAIAGLMLAASTLAGAAYAQSPARLSDAAYIAASRCAGLAQGAKADTAAIKSLLNNQDNDRNNYIREKADQAREDAQRKASHAQGYDLQTVNSELSGACQAYLKS